MCHRKALFISLAVLLFSCGTVMSLSIEDTLIGLTDQEYQDLRSWKVLEAQTLDGPIHQYAPQGSLAQKRAMELEQHEEGFSISSVSYMPYPYSFSSMTMEEKKLAVYNTMRRVSTQEGITYISHRRGEVPHVLIRDSWYLQTPRSRGRLPDPVAEVLPETEESYVYQRDTSFGGNVYRHTYTNTDREIFLDIDNIETMRILSVIPIVRPEQLTISMSAYFLDDGLLLYSIANIAERGTRVSFLGISVHLPSAFNRRITALQEWFAAQLYTH